MSSIRILIVDDHRLLMDALKDTLANEAEMEVIGTAASLSEALPLAAGGAPDVILLDHRLEDSEGSTATRALLEARPDCAVLLMSAAEPATVLAAATEAGIAGFVHKSSGLGAMVEALRTVAGGGTAT